MSGTLRSSQTELLIVPGLMMALDVHYMISKMGLQMHNKKQLNLTQGQWYVLAGQIVVGGGLMAYLLFKGLVG